MAVRGGTFLSILGIDMLQATSIPPPGWHTIGCSLQGSPGVRSWAGAWRMGHRGKSRRLRSHTHAHRTNGGGRPGGRRMAGPRPWWGSWSRGWRAAVMPVTPHHSTDNRTAATEPKGPGVVVAQAGGPGSASRHGATTGPRGHWTGCPPPGRMRREKGALLARSGGDAVEGARTRLRGPRPPGRAAMHGVRGEEPW